MKDDSRWSWLDPAAEKGLIPPLLSQSLDLQNEALESTLLRVMKGTFIYANYLMFSFVTFGLSLLCNSCGFGILDRLGSLNCFFFCFYFCSL